MVPEAITRQQLRDATDDVSTKLLAQRIGKTYQSWEELRDKHPVFATEIVDFGKVRSVVSEIRQIYPRIDRIARGLIGSYPHAFGAENLMVDVILSRIGPEEARKQTHPGAWTVGHHIVEEFFTVREEMGKGRHRVGVNVEDIVGAVLVGKVALKSKAKR